MSLPCTRCEGTGFLNAEFIANVEPAVLDHDAPDVLAWLESKDGLADLEDVTVCGCCGNGEDEWHGIPGEHYNSDDPEGDDGPYEYNGGLCECH